MRGDKQRGGTFQNINVSANCGRINLLVRNREYSGLNINHELFGCEVTSSDAQHQCCLYMWYPQSEVLEADTPGIARRFSLNYTFHGKSASLVAFARSIENECSVFTCRLFTNFCQMQVVMSRLHRCIFSPFLKKDFLQHCIRLL